MESSTDRRCVQLIGFDAVLVSLWSNLTRGYDVRFCRESDRHGSGQGYSILVRNCFKEVLSG